MQRLQQLRATPARVNTAALRLRPTALLVTGFASLWATPALSAITCSRTVTANVVAIDQPLMFNRLGAQNINGMMYALKRDVVDKSSGKPLTAGGVATPGNVELRADKRPRPLVIRVAAGDCLTVNFQNLLAPQANPRNAEPEALQVDDQVADRYAGFHPQGLELLTSIADDGSMVGKNANSLVAPGGSRTYKYYAPAEGTFSVSSMGTTFGSDGTQGNSANGLFGAINVQPKGARFYRSLLTEEEMRLATKGKTAAGQPIINYAATYPNVEPWRSEGKAGLPIVSMLTATNELVHTNIDAIIAGPNADGSFPASTYPLESKGKRNPTVPNRLEPFREFAVIFHDEVVAAQAFPGYYNDPVFSFTLEGVRDAFMINYGSGGIGSEIIANRLRVGPMHDCLSCAFEEFFLASSTVGDPGMIVDVPANTGLETLAPGQVPPPGAVGPKATQAFYPEDPSNVHHSYTNDFVKFRNLHVGREHHVFHLHNHQWLFNGSDDNSNYLDAQGIGPGMGYTYEIAFGGSGNRNKTAGDAIFHCHFYPHFAQGMWEMWRNHDTFEPGTKLAVSGNGYHTQQFGLQSGKPAAGSRALPDGEIAAGTPIAGLVPLPGKAMPIMPGQVTVVPKVVNGITVGSNAKVVDRTKNPGYPFWIAGIEHTVGQRAPTPPLDMLAAAGGFDGGLPRHSLDGFAAGGEAESVVSRLDFSKVIHKAKPVFFPEDGTDVEKVTMAFHAVRSRPSTAVNLDGTTAAEPFITNGSPPTPGAPFFEPCIDDTGVLMKTGTVGKFFSGETLTGMSTKGFSRFAADNPRVYKGANIQIDAVFNKLGYHYPQERIIALWDDVMPTIDKQRPPEPFVIRMNTYDCTNYLHTNLVPAHYELDDYQVRTPTDIIGQHIHLPKWDLPSADGSANGWNYEDGTLAPEAVVERIHAINAWNETPGHTPVATLDGETHLEPKPHPFFGQFGKPEWLGARTTIQRWFADPVVNVAGKDRGLGIIFTHDHYGPSTHQQIGLYATVLVEPAGSEWAHNETGEPMYTRHDGGPTSWQAAILPPSLQPTGINTGTVEAYREFYFEYSDFQHAYEKGVYVGVGPDGHPGNPPTADTFRTTINPPHKQQMSPIYPDVYVEFKSCPGGVARPCPQAISVDDPGMLVVNYRNEPTALRVYDPNRIGPDGKPGTQAAGLAGDLAYAYQTRTDRAIPQLNTVLGDTPYPPLNNDLLPGDPFTPMMRSYSGDTVRIRIQAGGHEEEHAITVHGVKWLQSGSGFGYSPNSGWRGGQAAGISEQFSFSTPVFADYNQVGHQGDYLYSMDAGNDGYWSGDWGLLRNYTTLRTDLFPLPTNPKPVAPSNNDKFTGVCPNTAPKRTLAVTAVLANDVLPAVSGVTVVPNDSAATMHMGGPLNANGGTLVYNPRKTVIPAMTVELDDGGTATIGGHAGPLHDPTAIMYVRSSDLGANGKLKPGVPVEPVVLRAAAGECIEVTLTNRLPERAPDLASLNTLLGVVKRDRNHPQGSTTFNYNLVAPSAHVGLHPQMVEYDVTKSDGMNVGSNPVQTAAPGQTVSYQWYAGDLRTLGQIVADTTLTIANLFNRERLAAASTSSLRNLQPVIATPVEFGGANLRPADPIKQGSKSLVGTMVVEPQGSTWVEDANMRAAATVTDGTAKFRDFAVSINKGLSMRYADGASVEAINGEAVGFPEDSQDASNMAINYRTEPLWFRFGVPPNAPFGNTAGGFGAIPNMHEAYSNVLTGGADPVTPVFTVSAGAPYRMRVLSGYGTTRGSTFQLHGHVWQRQPYVCPGLNGNWYLQIPGNCAPVDLIGSREIGHNALSHYTAAQESITPATHFDLVLPSAGGGNAVAGDYLYRDSGGFGNTAGLWGIVRVQ